MRRNLVAVALLRVFTLAASRATANFTTETVKLNDGSVAEVSLSNLHGTMYSEPYFIQRMSFSPNSNIILNVTFIPPEVAFLIFQVHTYQFNVTLAYDKDALHVASNRSVFGSNIGLYVNPMSSQRLQMFLKNDNVRAVQALLVVTLYDNKAPIPGGCNMEFNNKIAPYEKVSVRDGTVIVYSQPASMPELGNVQPNCGKDPVAHQMYRMYLPEQDFSYDTYFRSIATMLTVEDIESNGQKVSSSLFSLPMKRAFSAYTGIGSVYVMVASYGSHSAAYVPTFSYACSPVLYPESCDVLPDAGSKIVTALTFILGLLSLCLGHVNSSVDESLPVLFSGTVLGYMFTDRIGVGILIGSVIAAVWGMLRAYTMFGKWISALTFVIFVMSLCYFYGPATSVVLSNRWVFWTLVLVVSTIAIALSSVSPLDKIGHCVTCAIFSSYMIILPIDYWIGSSLKYIVINLIRCATVPDFDEVVIDAPVQLNDVVLLVFWVLLAVLHAWHNFFSPISFRCCNERSSEMEPLMERNEFGGCFQFCNR